ncbi:AraC family transcriptional regulator [Chitinophaga arvensicola]|nr:AraC family transcriptional regulator [Chitinophaga arvensicola]
MKGNLHYPFEISYKILEAGEKQQRQTNNFFELVYILEGNGRQTINQHAFDYAAGHLLLITPQDGSAFQVSTPTHMLLIGFDDIYIRSAAFSGNEREREAWIKRLEFILQHANHEPGCILTDQPHKMLAKAMVETLVAEYAHCDLYSKELINQMVNSLIILVARAIAKRLPDKFTPVADKKTLDIFQYIHEHIYEPEQLKVSAICRYFNISPNYLGKFFKRQADETLQQYIQHYKIKMVETRLLHSDMRINEIVAELNFTDESHLNRLFKKYKGMSASQYRKTMWNADISGGAKKDTGR